MISRFVSVAVLVSINLAIPVFAQDADLRRLACKVTDDPQKCKEQKERLVAGPPQDGKITIHNNSSLTIYKVFAWPTDLNPRTYNILNLPLPDGATTSVTIDNAYNDCRFTIQYDPNDPVKMRNRAAWQKRGFKVNGMAQTNVNVCGGKTYFWLGGVPDAKKQGKP